MLRFPYRTSGGGEDEQDAPFRDPPVQPDLDPAYMGGHRTFSAPSTMGQTWIRADKIMIPGSIWTISSWPARGRRSRSIREHGMTTEPRGRLFLFLAVVVLSTLGACGDETRSVSGTGANPSPPANSPPAPGDTTAPTISNVSTTDVTSTSVRVTWTTNENATSVVNYGLTNSYGSSASDSSNVTSHSVVLSGLSANTTYHFRVSSADGANNMATSDDATFATGASAPPPSVAPITISGTFSHGALITLSGTGFGTKSPARPLVWATFEPGQGAGGNDRNPTSKGLFTSWSRFQSASSLSTARAPVNSSQALRMDMARDIGWPPDAPADFADTFGAQITLAPADAGVMYYRGKVYKDWDIEQICQQYGVCSINDKMWRTWREGANQPINFYSNWHHAGNGGRDGRVTTENSGDNSPCSMWSNLPYPFHQWNTEEWLYRRSSGENVSDGALRFSINNVVHADMLNCVNLTSADSIGPTDFGIYEDFANVPNISPRPMGWWTYFKDVYIDNTWARVLVGDAINPDDATQTEIQLPVTWSNTSITIEANRGAFDSFSGKYVFVYNAQNQLVGSAQIPAASGAGSLTIGNDTSTQRVALPTMALDLAMPSAGNSPAWLSRNGYSKPRYP